MSSGEELDDGDVLDKKVRVVEPEVVEDDDALNEQCEVKMKLALAEIISFVEDQGIEAPKNLRVKCVEPERALACNSPNIDAWAAVNLKDKEKLAARYRELQFKVMFRTLFNIKLSEDVLKEFYNIVAKAMPPEGYGDDADVFIFKHDSVDDPNFPEMLFHEIWHLIEDRAGVLDVIDFTHEGTAVFAQKIFVNKPFPEPPEDPMADIFYAFATNLVDEFMCKNFNEGENPFNKLLDPSFRKSLDDFVKPRVTERYEELLASLQDRETKKKEIKQHIIDSEDYEEFKANPSKQNLLKVFRLRGQPLLAAFLELQDCTKLVNFYREIFE